MKPGCYTALITPFSDSSAEVDNAGLEKLVDFQIENGITGILAVGTTGESPVLSWDEHNIVVEKTARAIKSRAIKSNCLCIAGTGSNNHDEALLAAKEAIKSGVDAILMVDPYYNGPSSLEIRREYIAPIARACPEVSVIPYLVPGRTGTQLLPQDIAILHKTFKNINFVKDATCSLENMKQTKRFCGSDFTIISGDDPMTFEMMSHPEIKAGGTISVTSNIAPGPVSEMVALLAQGEIEKAKELNEALSPLFDIVTVVTTETTPYGDAVCKARNPLAAKTAMKLLGMPGGPCRKPLGKMTRKGLEIVVAALRKTQEKNPEILKPISDFFNVDIDARLNDASLLEGLYYEKYEDQ